MIRTTHTDDKTNDLLVSNEELNLDNEDASAWVVFDGRKIYNNNTISDLRHKISEEIDEDAKLNFTITVDHYNLQL